MKKNTKVPSREKLRYSMNRKSKKRRDKIAANIRSNLVSNNFYISNINIGNLKNRINSSLQNAHSQNSTFLELRKKMMANRSSRSGNKKFSHDFGKTGYDKLKIEGRSAASKRKYSSSRHKKSSSFNSRKVSAGPATIDKHSQFQKISEILSRSKFHSSVNYGS